MRSCHLVSPNHPSIIKGLKDKFGGITDELRNWLSKLPALVAAKQAEEAAAAL